MQHQMLGTRRLPWRGNSWRIDLRQVPRQKHPHCNCVTQDEDQCDDQFDVREDRLAGGLFPVRPYKHEDAECEEMAACDHVLQP